MKIRFLVNFLLLALFLVVSTNQAFAAGVPIPFRIGGTLTIDGVQKLQADTGIVVKVTKPDGTAYSDASGNPPQATALNASNWYLINVPIYDATAQPSGANTNDSAVIHVLLNGTELSVTSPASGVLTVGASGTTQQIDLVAVSQVNGACGTADAQTFTIAPTTNLCSAGAESAVTGTGPWNWSCNGSNGGTNANCSANIQTYTVTGVGDANGTVACQSPVNQGSSSVCTITPATGYHLVTMTDDGVDKLASVSNNSYTTSNVLANHTLTATFDINSYTITGSGDANGTVSCLSPVNYNTISACTITPAANYHLATFTDNSVDKLASVSSNSFTISNVQTNHTVVAIFAIDTHTVTPAIGTGSSTTPVTAQTVNHGSTTSFTVTPAAGYGISAVTGCGGTRVGTTYNTGPITANCTVTVTSIAHNGHADGVTQASLSDALNALLSVVGKKTLTAEEALRYDVAPISSNGIPQGNGTVDIADVIMILRRTIGIGNW